MKNQSEKILSRRFLGKLDNFENNQERLFETKHLKAYIKGHTHFIHGRVKLENGNVVPAFHSVKQEYFEIDNPRFKK